MNSREGKSTIDIRQYGCVDEVAEKVGVLTSVYAK